MGFADEDAAKARRKNHAATAVLFDIPSRVRVICLRHKFDSTGLKVVQDVVASLDFLS